MISLIWARFCRITVKHVRTKSAPKHYTPCPASLGFVKKCYVETYFHRAKTEDNLQCWWLTSCILLCWTTSKPSPEYTGEVTARMISDHITDLLLTQLGMFMFRQYGLSQRQLISSHISTLSWLQIKLHRSTGKSDLSLINLHMNRIFWWYRRHSSAHLPDGNKSKSAATYFEIQSIFRCQNKPRTSQVCRFSVKYENFFLKILSSLLASGTLLRHPIIKSIACIFFLFLRHNNTSDLAAIDNTAIDLDKAINHSLSHKTTFRSLAEYLSHEAKFTMMLMIIMIRSFCLSLLVHFIRWNDNSRVIQKAEKAQKKTIEIDQPSTIKH